MFYHPSHALSKALTQVMKGVRSLVRWRVVGARGKKEEERDGRAWGVGLTQGGSCEAARAAERSGGAPGTGKEANKHALLSVMRAGKHPQNQARGGLTC